MNYVSDHGDPVYLTITWGYYDWRYW
jgi:hypothetical protein